MASETYDQRLQREREATFVSSGAHDAQAAQRAREQELARQRAVQQSAAQGQADYNSRLKEMYAPKPSTAAPAPATPPAAVASASLAGLQSAAGGGATVPMAPPVTSGAGDGGAAMTDSGIDRILGAQQGGGASMAGLRQGIGMRQYPSHAFVLQGKRVY